MKTFNQFINESFNLNKTEEEIATRFVKEMWMRLLYLNYKDLNKTEPISITEDMLENMKDVLDSIEDGDEDEDDIEWACEGMSINGKKQLNQKTVDYLFELASKPITKPLTVYRTTNWNRKQDNWMSTSKDSEPYNEITKEITIKSFDLPVGFKIIDCNDGFQEVIISLKELQKYKLL